MSKIICEICGTKYLDTAPCCPICGWKQSAVSEGAADSDDFDLDLLNSEGEDPISFEDEKFTDMEPEKLVPMAKTSASGKKKEAFDFDAVNTGKPSKPAKRTKKPEPVEEEPEEEEEEEEEEESHSNPFLVIILVILIVALLATSGFIFWKYYLGGGEEADDFSFLETEEVTETSAETEEPTIPCASLSLVSGIEDLTAEGQFWLLHVKAAPEDTTDVITYTSADPAVATVNEEGRVTAVAEGETKIIITCGSQTIEAPVVVSFVEAIEAETEAVVTTEPEETEEEETDTPVEEEEEVEETKHDVDPNVVLKLKRTDLTFGIMGVYSTLELDCDLTAEDVTFSSRNTNVARVNEKGEVTAMGPGLTVITVTYGSQSVECIIRCNF